MELHGWMKTDKLIEKGIFSVAHWPHVVLEEDRCLMLCEGGSVYVSGELSPRASITETASRLG